MIPHIEKEVADRLNELEVPTNAFNSVVLKREFKAFMKGKRLMVVHRPKNKLGIVLFYERKKVK
jgi:hypothetical protein